MENIRFCWPLMKNEPRTVGEIWKEWDAGLEPSFLSLKWLNGKFKEDWRCTDASKKKYSNRSCFYRAVETVLSDMKTGMQILSNNMLLYF